jgi:hypothetical protein
LEEVVEEEKKVEGVWVVKGSRRGEDRFGDGGE